MKERYKKQIELGAAALDIEKPGWEKLIKLSKLNLNDTRKCVLGQVYGNYYIGLSELFGPGVHILADPEPYGFFSEPAQSGALKREWKAFLANRKSKQAKHAPRQSYP